YFPMYGLKLEYQEFDFSAGSTVVVRVCLNYFLQFFYSAQFSSLMRILVLISVITVLLVLIAVICLALLVLQVVGRRRKMFFQSATYLPHFISIVVIVGMLQVFLSPTSGLITRVAQFFGATDVNYLGDTSTFVPVYVISEVWQHCGWNSIIYLAALASVDTQLYEAARIDGAGRMTIIRHIDFPALVP